ncbi:hypothetical protein DEO72_LG4g393 [Vigna unguiculata]|uniref:Uncharacterized protein n=1 Tax=Vigna unguiculata TaxID=3917 RepID=A0A4D6LL11_VIGUN|nr:hypothetical protein DEO72_LG4g393 [Vigna unguiculata]
MKGGVALAGLQLLEWNLAELVQTRRVAACVEGCVFRSSGCRHLGDVQCSWMYTVQPRAHGAVVVSVVTLGWIRDKGSNVCTFTGIHPSLRLWNSVSFSLEVWVLRTLKGGLRIDWCGFGSSSLCRDENGSGRGLVRVLYPLACVKQWGRDRCFTLFRLVASLVPDVQCIDVFTHNSLRNKGESLAALSGTHRTICSRKLDVVLGGSSSEKPTATAVNPKPSTTRWCDGTTAARKGMIQSAVRSSTNGGGTPKQWRRCSNSKERLREWWRDSRRSRSSCVERRAAARRGSARRRGVVVRRSACAEEWLRGGAVARGEPAVLCGGRAGLVWSACATPARRSGCVEERPREENLRWSCGAGVVRWPCGAGVET